MFRSGMKETLVKVLPIRGVQWELFEYVLKYIYKINISQDIDATGAVQLWMLSDVYDIRNLQIACLEYVCCSF